MIDVDELRDMYKLKSIIRYNTRKHLKDESVAEHSFYVALISLKLCDMYKLDDDTTRKIVIKALLHDMPEIELNDITHDAKEKLNLRQYLKKYEDEYYNVNFSKYAQLMNTDRGLISNVVDLADAISVYQFIDNEILLGNKAPEIHDILKDTTIRINTLKNKLHTKLYMRSYYEKHKKI